MSDNVTRPETDEQLRRIYGEGVVISRVGKFTLIHLDSPTPETVATREAEFDPNEFFIDSCPLCKEARELGGHIVYDGATDAEMDDVLEADDLPDAES